VRSGSKCEFGKLVAVTCYRNIYISPTPSLNFTPSDSAKCCLDFRQLSHLTSFDLETEQDIGFFQGWANS